MITNGAATIYQKNWQRGSVSYTRIAVPRVNWQDVSRIAIRDSGLSADDVAKIFIPGIGTSVRKGDVIVRGNTDFELAENDGQNLKALQSACETVRTVISVSRCNNGSSDIQHLEVIAK